MSARFPAPPASWQPKIKEQKPESAEKGYVGTVYGVGITSTIGIPTKFATASPKYKTVSMPPPNTVASPAWKISDPMIKLMGDRMAEEANRTAMMKLWASGMEDPTIVPREALRPLKKIKSPICKHGALGSTCRRCR
jgi:hypothetical protein